MANDVVAIETKMDVPRRMFVTITVPISIFDNVRDDVETKWIRAMEKAAIAESPAAYRTFWAERAAFWRETLTSLENQTADQLRALGLYADRR